MNDEEHTLAVKVLVDKLTAVINEPGSIQIKLDALAILSAWLMLNTGGPELFERIHDTFQRSMLTFVAQSCDDPTTRAQIVAVSSDLKRRVGL